MDLDRSEEAVSLLFPHYPPHLSLRCLILFSRLYRLRFTFADSFPKADSCTLARFNASAVAATLGRALGITELLTTAKSVSVAQQCPISCVLLTAPTSPLKK